MGMFRRLDPVQHRDRFRHELKMDRDEFAWRQRREMNEDKREDRARELRLKAQQQQATAAQRAADQREKEAARAEAAAWSRPVTRYTGGTSRGDRHLGEPLIVEHFALPVSVAVLPPVGSGAPPLVSAAEVFLDADPALRVLVVGHADPHGKAEQNRDLSGRRATSVMTYLTGHGVEATRLEAHGYGPDRPIADNKKPKGRALNRRTDFRILDPAQPIVGLADSKKLSEKRRLALEQQREDIEAMLTEIAQFETQCQQELTRRNTR